MSAARPGNGRMPRVVEPEWLDALDESDPRAVASRRDLLRVNRLMGQAAIAARSLRRHLPGPPARLLELGCGDGAFMLALARRLARHWPGVHVVLLDREDLVTSERRAAVEALGWRIETVRSDVFEWLETADRVPFDAALANLFVHHFDGQALQHLLQGIALRAPVFVATEPRRGRFAAAATRLLWAIGANDVTRNDAAASVRAGFAGTELSGLWPGEAGSRFEERSAGLFTHLFAAFPAAGGKTP